VESPFNRRHSPDEDRKRRYLELAERLEAYADNYESNGFPEQAVKLYQQALEARSKISANEGIGSAPCCEKLASIFLASGSHEEAKDMLLRLIRMKESSYGMHDLRLTNDLQALGSLYRLLGYYKEAKRTFIRAWVIREAILGSCHLDTAKSLHSIALVHADQGAIGKARELLLQSLHIYSSAHTYHEGLIASCIGDLGLIFDSFGDHAKAHQCYRFALTAKEKILEQEEGNISETFIEVAVLYFLLADYRSAARLFFRTLRHLRGPRSNIYTTAVCFRGLAEVFQVQGHFGKAEIYFTRALELYKRTFHHQHPDIARCMSGLADLYYVQSAYEKAKTHYLEALEIRGRVLGFNHPDTSLSVTKLANLYGCLGEFDKAKHFFLMAKQHMEKIFPPMHPAVADILRDFAFVNIKQRDFIQAKQLLLQSLAIYEKRLDPEHLSTAICLERLAYLHHIASDFSTAKSLYSRALCIKDKVLGPNHPETLDVAKELASVHLSMGNYTESLLVLEGLHRYQHKYLREELPMMPVERREKYLKCIAGSRKLFFESRILLASESSPLARAWAALALRCSLQARLDFHGLLQEIERRQHALYRLHGCRPRALDRLVNLTRVLSSTGLIPATRSTLKAERDQLEQELFNLDQALKIHPINIAELISTLPENGALIEFELVTTTSRYQAIVLSRPTRRSNNNSHYPDNCIKHVDLSSASEMDAKIEDALLSSIRSVSDQSDRWHVVSKALVLPLLPSLKGIKHWFVSLDGALHRVPFGSLPWPDGSDRWVTSVANVVILSSGRDLLSINNAVSSGRSSVVVANPYFNKSNSLTAASDGNCGQRSRDMNSLNLWDPLPGSAKEGLLLADLLGGSLMVGCEATTTNLMRLSSPLVLHIATHGYFLPDNEDEFTSSLYGEASPLVNFQGEDPMLRSGLVLAGANHIDNNPEDDGYLTALEATHLDLQGTELVTLSACDTGRGDIHTGEGVYGLQRSLIVAGARSLLLSLWKVPDDATCEFMVRFYSLLKQGAGRYEALVAVQCEFRAHRNPIWRDIHYWGAWQLIGDWRPIQGL